MSDDYLDRDPGFYIASEPIVVALIEQQRASIIDVLRTTKAASVTMLEANGDGRHWGVYIRDDHAAEFMVYAAVRAVRDAAAACDTDPESVCRLVLDAIERGIGS